MGRLRSLPALALAATVLVPTAVAQQVLAPTILHTARVPAVTVKSFSVACPPGYVATSGGTFRAAPGATVVSRYPTGARAFAFRIGNASAGQAHSVTAAVACRKLRSTSAGTALTVRTVRSKPLLVPAAGRRAWALVCPSGTAPAGAGVDLDPRRAAGPTGFTGTRLSVRRMTTDLHRFLFVVRNSGRTAHSVAFSGNCITVVRPRGAAARSLHVRLLTFREVLQPGRQELTRSCPRGAIVLAVGYGVPAGLAVEATAAIRRGGKWSFANSASTQLPATLQLVCGAVA
jgi:hypothetical protein